MKRLRLEVCKQGGLLNDGLDSMHSEKLSFYQLKNEQLMVKLNASCQEKEHNMVHEEHANDHADTTALALRGRHSAPSDQVSQAQQQTSGWLNIGCCIFLLTSLPLVLLSHSLSLCFSLASLCSCHRCLSCTVVSHMLALSCIILISCLGCCMSCRAHIHEFITGLILTFGRCSSTFV